MSPTLIGRCGGGGGGTLTAATASYASTTLNVAANLSGSLSFGNAPYFGTDLLDRSVPDSPTVLVAGVYVFTCVFRIVIALGGAPTAGSGHAGAINGAGGGQQPKGFFTTPTAAGTWVPQWSVTSIPAHLDAGSLVTFRVTNSDGASARVYDSPGMSVTLLTVA